MIKRSHCQNLELHMISHIINNNNLNNNSIKTKTNKPVH